MILKHLRRIVCLTMLVMVFGNATAQKRNSQIEVFAGSAVPLSPEFFRENTKLGISLHGQYVIFPSPRLGISFGAAYEGFTSEELDFGLADLKVVEAGIGLRPYLGSADSRAQPFLFAMGTLNYVDQTFVSSSPFLGVQLVSSSDDFLFGVGGGGGVELPAGSSFNVILQGVARVIFNSGSNLSFIGITAGLVF